SPIDITAAVRGVDPGRPDDVTTVRGQVQVASTVGRVLEVSLEPDNPPACPEALAAVDAADWVVLGPGSWFTSVIPHLLVPDLRKALASTSARKVVTVNLEPQTGETDGFSPETHLEVLASHAPELTLDVVVADQRSVVDLHRLRATAASLGARLVVADVAADDGSPRHDPVKLANAYAGFLTPA
ncbi:MAG: gluconeogenesis factor YvcK family protein, partial [Nocardioidaceae bacterium]